MTVRTPTLARILALAAVLSAAAAGPAAAQPARCGERARVLDHLASAYGESRRAAGRAANDVLVELFASDATGSWTITATLPNGMTCLLAAGEGFEALTASAAVPGTPA
ncbi:MAG: hypothetical protein KJZ85_12395 [Rhodobacteraceae bacterium]|jgi:hypothetical protein|nr:hypothetical protein [Paracoccaceae bacterium]